MGDAVARPPEAETPALSFPERLVGVFISPGATFADVAREPDFILPVALLVLIAVAGTEIFLYKIGMEPILRWAFEHSSRAANMPPDQMQGMIGKMISFYTWMGHVSGVVWVPFIVLVGATIGFVTVRSIFGGRISFKTGFSIASYAYTVNIIYYLMVAAMILFGDPEHYISNPQSPTPTSVGFFLNPIDTSKPLLSLGSSLEIFTVWNLVLLAIGFSAASGRKAKAFPIFFVFLGLWILKVLIAMGLATLG